jgi:steroid 5-alpha reductase family enzyme
MNIPSYEMLGMFFIATALGTLLGLERKRSEKYFDVKIFSLSALMGSIATVFSAWYGGIAELFPLAGFILIILFTYRIYKDGEDKELIELRRGMEKKIKTKPALKTRINKAGIDAITAYVLPITYLIGMMTGSSMAIEAAGITFLILGLLTIGNKFENVAKILSE